MSGNKFARLNAKVNDTHSSSAIEVVNELTNKPLNQQTAEPINKQTGERIFAPTFANLPGGSGVSLTIDDLRLTLLEVGKEQRSFSLHQSEKVALDRATFSLKMLGKKADANRIARAALAKALADLDEKGEESFIYQMIDNLSK